MKTLFVMRHAKSDWNNADLSDFERPLNQRGQKVAPLMGALMRENDFQPDVIISSPAERANQTALAVKEAARFAAAIEFDERIYEASPHTLLKIIQEIGGEYQTAMIVGHNPGFENLVKTLTGKSQPMPTAALAIIDLQIDEWSAITTETGTLRDFIRPKERLDS